MAKMLLHHKVGVQAMQCHIMKILVVTSVFLVVKAQTGHNNVEPSDSSFQDLLMKGARPEKLDEYMHSSYPISDQKAYIYKFEAIANAETVHHMILYGCNHEQSNEGPVWKNNAICEDGSETILFAWAKNAPPTVLPKGVGVRIGKNSTVKSFVLQVHYARAFEKEEKADHSGMRIYTTHKEQAFVAGIFMMLESYFIIPPGVPSYPVDISCNFNMEKSIYPIAFRTHAHSLGTVITGYIHDGAYHLIGKGNPRWPQSFYPVHDEHLVIKPGDSLAARCTYDSTVMNYSVSVGSTGKDEMCNFYIMFYTDSSVVNPSGLCVGNNIPALTGSNFPSDVSEPLPPNPDLEERAKGNHNHGSINGTVNPESQHDNTSADTWTKDLLMKGAKPDKPDAYLCAAYPVAEEEAYIYKFEALANALTVHHILVYGCNGEPYSDKPFWRCPLMCKNLESTILFAWAKNAPPTALPKDVGLRIGQKTTIKSIVLQVHYARVFPADEKPDTSGIRVYVTHKKQPFVAGIFFLGSSLFSIPPGRSSYPVEVSCQFNLKKSIFPFAYRTHSHGLGRVITGYYYNDTYYQIGKGNPQWPQAFYPVKTKIEVKPGEYLAARCTYNSMSMAHSVSVGSTGVDEMCNFYIMFYTENSVEDPSGQCNGNYLPRLTGDHFPADVSDPLPPNPQLEEEAKGLHHSHHGGSDSETLESIPADTKTQDLIIKGAKPNKAADYLCSAYTVTELESYIYKFEAIGNLSLVHHIVVYSCDGKPFSSESLWGNCQDICMNGQYNSIWAWAKNAGPTVLPQGVGMPIGQQTHTKTIVLQIRYARAFAANQSPDHSGVRIYTTQKKPSFVAGVYMFIKDGFYIPSGNPSYTVDLSCRFSREKSIFPFLYMTHTHNLGKVLTAYHYNDSYHQIVKGNPQWPQAFYPIKDKIEVKPGDRLAARCTYDSTFMNHSVRAGEYSSDEMCNILIMFYTDSSDRDLYYNCSTDSEPQISGIHFPSDVSVPLPPNPALEEEAKGLDLKGIHFDHKLEIDSSWPIEKIEIGQIGGVATDIDGNVYIFHRGSREWNIQSFSIDNDFMYKDTPIPDDVIIVLNSQGQLVRKFGAGQYFMPHGIEVDKYKNIWITDVALHQVFKIPHGETQPSLVLGHRFQHGLGWSYFCKPTDVAVLSSGAFFVSDGYCNSRVLKFSKDGALIQSWGEKSLFPAIPSPVTFSIPHSITVSEENQLVCVADRENGQIQCFDLDGNFKYIIKHSEFGTRLFAIEQSPIYGGVLYAVNGPSFSYLPDVSVQGFTLDIKTGDILEIWNVPQHLKNPHDVCVHTGSQSVYIGELNPQAVWKLFRSTPDEPVHVHVSMKQDNATQNEIIAMITTASFKEEHTFDKISGIGENNISLVEEKRDRSDSNYITPAILIGCLLVVPVVLLLIIILLVRAYKTGKLKCCPQNKQMFSFSRFLGSSHKGFDPINMEDSDHDSEHEEYITPKKIKNSM